MQVKPVDEEVSDPSKSATPNDDNEVEPSESQSRLELPIKLPGNTYKHKCLWLIVIVSVCIGFTIHLVSLITQYLEFSVSSEVSVRKGSYEFPDVTLCNTNFLPEVAVNEIDSLSSDFDPAVKYPAIKYSFANIARMLQQLKTMKAKVDNPPLSSYKHARIALRQLAYRTKQYSDPHEIVMLCKFMEQACSYENFTVYKDEEYYKCLTFSPKNRILRRSGPGKGLFLALSLTSRAFLDKNEEMSHVKGYNIVLHRKGEKPNLRKVTALAPVRQKTVISIETSISTKLNTKTSPCAVSLPNVTYVIDYSQRDGQPITASYLGSESDCPIRHIQQLFLTECGCLASNLPLPVDLYAESTGVCHRISEKFLHSTISFNTTDQSYVIELSNGTRLQLLDYLQLNWSEFSYTRTNLNCFKRVNRILRDEGIKNLDCINLCSTIKHRLKSVVYPWPRYAESAYSRFQELLTEMIAEYESKNMTVNELVYLRETFRNESDISRIAVIDLSPAELDIQVTSDHWAYPLRNFFSDFGGILGLWMGMSIITIFELADVVARSASIAIMARLKRMRKQEI